MQQPDLEVRRVGKRYAAHVAVDQLSFSVAHGSFFSILGPSGCGKTDAGLGRAGADLDAAFARNSDLSRVVNVSPLHAAALRAQTREP